VFDTSYIGHGFSPFSVEVEKAPLRLFAKSIGENDPVYYDEQAAQTAGHRSILAPPTYAFSLRNLGPFLSELDALLEIGDAVHLHGEQSFEYSRPFYAGDTLSFSERITDIYSKAGGRLDFAVAEAEVINQHGELVVKLRSTSVVQRTGADS